MAVEYKVGYVTTSGMFPNVEEQLKAAEEECNKQAGDGWRLVQPMQHTYGVWLFFERDLRDG